MPEEGREKSLQHRCFEKCGDMDRRQTVSAMQWTYLFMYPIPHVSVVVQAKKGCIEM